MTPSPFHAGEQHMQRLAGVRELAESRGSMIRPFMPDQHRDFFAQLPFVIVGGLDARQRPWASVLTGPPGFVQSPDPRHLRIAGLSMGPDDPAASCLHPGAPLALLGIQPHTRRRNRMNGTLLGVDSQGYDVAVRQSFGNCPKYIQAREATWLAPNTLPPPAPCEPEGPLLSPAAQALIEHADTFYIASSSLRAAHEDRGESEGLDVSHRGGKPGFIRVTQEDGASVLTIPDFMGNSLFNTLGNIMVRPEAGVLFIDFSTRDTLQLSVRGEVLQEHPDLAAFAGAQRMLRLIVVEGRLVRLALPLRWGEATWAPQLAATGQWKG